MPEQPVVIVDVAGAVERLGRAMQAASDLSPVLAGPINKQVDDFFKRQFNSEGKFGGTPWAPHRPVTKLLRKRRGRGRGGILRDTSRLWASLTKLGLGPDSVREVTRNSLTRGTSLKYAQFHQTGFVSVTFPVISKLGDPVFLRRKVGKKIPARPIVPDRMPASVVKTWTDTIEKFIMTKAQ